MTRERPLLTGFHHDTHPDQQTCLITLGTMTTNRDRSACSTKHTRAREFPATNNLIPRHSSCSTPGVPGLAKTAPYLACTGTTSRLKNRGNGPDAAPGNVTSLNRRAVIRNKSLIYSRLTVMSNSSPLAPTRLRQHHDNLLIHRHFKIS